MLSLVITYNSHISDNNHQSTAGCRASYVCAFLPHTNAQEQGCNQEQSCYILQHLPHDMHVCV